MKRIDLIISILIRLDLDNVGLGFLEKYKLLK
jgi:hypothetical protein